MKAEYEMESLVGMTESATQYGNHHNITNAKIILDLMQKAFNLYENMDPIQHHTDMKKILDKALPALKETLGAIQGRLLAASNTLQDTNELLKKESQMTRQELAQSFKKLDERVFKELCQPDFLGKNSSFRDASILNLNFKSTGKLRETYFLIDGPGPPCYGRYAARDCPGPSHPWLVTGGQFGV